MKVVRWKLRECSVRLRRCALTGRGSAARAERGVLAETRDDYDKIPVKVESEGEDAVFHPVLNAEPGNLWKDSMTDIILHGKEENDLKRIEDEVVIKQELDIGPTILQPKTMARSFPPITSVFLQPSAPDPRPTTDSASGAASALACLGTMCILRSLVSE
ncbi:hypothetical protein EVAR_56581_1 [Eumeta japonica]|uniref:Uncharacterized protein n=1 Tax=Eumeta variegata TaxID=151549 RepID=A0A4C1Z192_EUMVA|nr:hypothetical protein EVAR_56581_1 [Eumeta japonica]